MADASSPDASASPGIPIPQRASVLISAREAVAAVEPGATIGLGGILNSAHPMAIVRELIRQGTGDLHVVGLACGLEVDMLIAAGLVRRLTSSAVSAESLAPAAGPAFRHAAQRGEIEVSDLDEGLFQVALQAAAQRVPFAPWLGGLGTSLPQINDDLLEIDSPFGGGRVIAVRALPLDVAFIHASRGDRYGNVQPAGGGHADKALARAAKRTICSVERVVGNPEIRATPSRTSVAGVDGVVHAPYGAHPFASPGHYLVDEDSLRAYLAAAKAWTRNDDRGPLDEYFEQWLSGPADHWEYMDRVGAERLYGLEEGLNP